MPVSYSLTPGHLITDIILQCCAVNFSTFYAVWSCEATHSFCASAIPGTRVHMDTKQVKRLCLSTGANNVLVTATSNGHLVGHCFASQWTRSGDSVWWITQLLVLPWQRGQKVATTMLKTLAKHINHEKRSEREFVGLLSPNPLAICAVLRVFGRGIEALPSRADWIRNPSAYPHAPLQSYEAKWLMGIACPIDHLSRAVLDPVMLTAQTCLYSEQRESHHTLKGIKFSMNKQVREPWEWMFGDLKEGSEYLCVMRYSYDPAYDMRARLCSRQQASPPPQRLPAVRVDEQSSASTPKRFARYRSILSRRPPHISYTYLDKLIKYYPALGTLSAQAAYRIAQSKTSAAVAQRIFEAKAAMAARGTAILEMMDAKCFPNSLLTQYLGQECRPFVKTWTDLKQWAEEDYDPAARLRTSRRLTLLQAIHFNELLEEFDKLRMEADMEWDRQEQARLREEQIEEEKQRRAAKRASFRLSAASGLSFGLWSGAAEAAVSEMAANAVGSSSSVGNSAGNLVAGDSWATGQSSAQGSTQRSTQRSATGANEAVRSPELFYSDHEDGSRGTMELQRPKL